MHRLKSRFTIYRFRFAALLLCAKLALLPVTSAVMLWAIITRDHPLALLGAELIAVMVFVAILQWIVAARTSCPLCMTPVLARKHCVTHRHAHTLLGSHRLRVALAILFKNSFRCPYCHEPTEMKVRVNKPHAKSPADGRD